MKKYFIMLRKGYGVFMSQNWVTNLDLCAMNGIIDYDAGAYLRGLPPRYIGNPARPVPPMTPPPQYGKQPGLAPQAVPVDKLDLSGKEQAKQPVEETPEAPELPQTEVKKSTPWWKSILFTVVAVGSAIFIGCKLKNTKMMKAVTKFFKSTFKNIKTGLGKFWNWIKKPFTKKP